MFGVTQRPTEGWKVLWKREVKPSGVSPLQSVGMGRLEVSSLRAEHPTQLGNGALFCFVWLIVSWKWEQKWGRLSVMNQVLTLWGQLLEGLLFSFLDCSWRFPRSLIYRWQAGFLSWLMYRMCWSPGLVAADCGQNWIIVTGLAIVHFHIQSLSMHKY